MIKRDNFMMVVGFMNNDKKPTWIEPNIDEKRTVIRYNENGELTLYLYGVEYEEDYCRWSCPFNMDTDRLEVWHSLHPGSDGYTTFRIDVCTNRFLRI